VTKFIQTLVIGVQYGCIYALIAMGMVLVYRTTGVLNIAHGGIGVLAGFVAWDLNSLRNWPYFAAIAAGIAVAIVSGLLFERFIVQGLVFVVPWWGNTWGQAFDSPFRTWKPVAIPGANYSVSWDQLVLFGNVIVFFAGLYYILRRTRVGLAMRAVSDDPTAARLMGIRERLVSPVVWGMAFGLSGLTTMLLAPILNLDNTSLTAFTLKALTVTFVGGLTSLPLTVAGAFALSGLEVWSQLYAGSVKGLSDAWPFIILIVVLVARFARGTKALEDTAVAPA
jgi:branched-subunit amino acid ABC-type transport system permease component